LQCIHCFPHCRYCTVNFAVIKRAMITAALTKRGSG
jgi:hypothetical protein